MIPVKNSFFSFFSLSGVCLPTHPPLSVGAVSSSLQACQNIWLIQAGRDSFQPAGIQWWHLNSELRSSFLFSSLGADSLKTLYYLKCLKCYALPTQIACVEKYYRGKKSIWLWNLLPTTNLPRTLSVVSGARNAKQWRNDPSRDREKPWFSGRPQSLFSYTVLCVGVITATQYVSA